MNARIDPRDHVATTEWAMACVPTGGAGHASFSLVNQATGKGYALHVPTLALSLGGAADGKSTFVLFRTEEPVAAAAFNGVNVRMTTARAGVFDDRAVTYLTIRKDPSAFSDVLAYVKLSDTGAMVAGGGVFMGITAMADSAAASLRDAAIVLDLDLGYEIPTICDTRVRFKPKQDKKRIILEADAAFDVDSDRISKDGEKALEQCAFFLNMRETERVTITGYTDSVRTEERESILPARRAKSVRAWFEKNWTLGAGAFRAFGLGNGEPLEPDRIGGRAGNRRVEIVYR